MNVVNVLVFPGGMENGIEIYNSLKSCKEVNLFSASSNIPNQAFFIYKENNIVRSIYEDGWVDDLNNIIGKHNIDLIYPANSLIIDALSLNKDKIKTNILLPDERVLEVTRSKTKTINALKGVVPVPDVYVDIESIKKLPVFVKPDRGYGAQGAELVNAIEQLDRVNFSTNIVQEYLTGKEYTVDCFSDSNGELLFCGGRERSRVRMATSMHAEKVSDNLAEIFEDYAKKILSRIKISGTWFFQLKESNDGELKLLEIDVRIAGTMCYNRCRGVNFALLSILQHLGRPVSVLTNPVNIVLDRCLKNRYILDYVYENVYVDLDDTIIVKSKINLEIIRFLYQSVNNNKKIILLTKHLGDDLKGYLEKYKIYQIFDEIHHMEETVPKYTYIKSNKSIFIDDSFSQRKDVFEKCGIPTFDTSMIEGLIDDRI